MNGRRKRVGDSLADKSKLVGARSDWPRSNLSTFVIISDSKLSGPKSESEVEYQSEVPNFRSSVISLISMTDLMRHAEGGSPLQKENRFFFTN